MYCLLPVSQSFEPWRGSRMLPPRSLALNGIANSMALVIMMDWLRARATQVLDLCPSTIPIHCVMPMIWSKHKWESRMTNIFLLYYQVKQVYIYFSYIYLLSKSLDGKFTWNVCIFCVLCTELNTGYISSKYIQERIPK
jgi:hypothetical protein